MTIFDFINDVLFTKKNTMQSLDDESTFSPYMLNRWISMYSPAMARDCNIINKYLGAFENKKDLFNLFVATFKKVPFKRINYIKKHKEEKKEECEQLDLLAKSYELSKREIKQYLELKDGFLKGVK
jgi:hypothetical protein